MPQLQNVWQQRCIMPLMVWLQRHTGFITTARNWFRRPLVRYIPSSNARCNGQLAFKTFLQYMAKTTNTTPAGHNATPHTPRHTRHTPKHWHVCPWPLEPVCAGFFKQMTGDKAARLVIALLWPGDPGACTSDSPPPFSNFQGATIAQRHGLRRD